MASTFVSPRVTSVTVPLPTRLGGYKANDIVFLFVYVTWDDPLFDPNPIATPAGWLPVAQEEAILDAGGVIDRFAVFYWPVTVDGGGPPAPPEITWAELASVVARTVVYRNVNLAAPFVLTEPIQVGPAGDPATVDVQVATLLPNTRVVCAFTSRSSINQSSFDINDVAGDPFNRRSQTLTSDATSPQAGSFGSFGSFPDQSLFISGDDIYSSMSIADRVYAVAGTIDITGTIESGPYGALVQAMGIAFRLNEAA
jgi:hypothetical protein